MQDDKFPKKLWLLFLTAVVLVTFSTVSKNGQMGRYVGLKESTTHEDANLKDLQPLQSFIIPSKQKHSDDRMAKGQMTYPETSRSPRNSSAQFKTVKDPSTGDIPSFYEIQRYGNMTYVLLRTRG